jgi:outer membrane protein assembly factor BamB
MDRDGNDQTVYPIPETSSMSSALWNDNIVIADKKGTLLIMDSSNGSTVSSIETGSLQVVAQAPAIAGNRAVFASRKGIVSAVDLASGSVLWERKLDRTVFANIIAADEGCYVYTTKRELYALSWDTGEDLFPALSDISAVPGYDKGKLYMTNRSGMMNVVNAGSGKVEGSLDLKDSFTAKPIIRNGILIGVGTNGNFFRINTEGIR